MIDEASLRKPTFDEANSAPVAFPGGVFYLPKPVVYLRPIFVGGRRVNEAKLSTDDAEFDRLKDAAVAASSDEEADFSGAMIDIAAYMLLKNYDLGDDDLGRVFAVRESGDGVSVSWWSAVMEVAHGRGPKQSPAT